MSVDPAVKEFWQEFCDATGHKGEAPDHHYRFGDSPEMADELLGLILHGEKRASADLLLYCQQDGSWVPEVGEYSVVMDSDGVPRCVVCDTDVVIRPFRDVDAAFARAEGEGDKSLEYWRRVHHAYFERWLHPRGLEFSEDLEIVCERFELVYPLGA